MDANSDKFTDDIQEFILAEAKKKYSPTVIDHWMHPRNFNEMPDPDGQANYLGPCGDNMQIFLKVKDDKITQATFLTDGCGTTIACGSMITELVTGKSIAEAWQITDETVLKALSGLPEENQHCAKLAATTFCLALCNYEKIKKEPWKKNYPKEII